MSGQNIQDLMLFRCTISFNGKVFLTINFWKNTMINKKMGVNHGCQYQQTNFTLVIAVAKLLFFKQYFFCKIFIKYTNTDVVSTNLCYSKVVEKLTLTGIILVYILAVPPTTVWMNERLQPGWNTRLLIPLFVKVERQSFVENLIQNIYITKEEKTWKKIPPIIASKDTIKVIS